MVTQTAKVTVLAAHTMVMEMVDFSIALVLALEQVTATFDVEVDFFPVAVPVLRLGFKHLDFIS